MRTVRSFDPCLPCGVHMYLGKGKVLEEDALADAGAEPRARADRATQPGAWHVRTPPNLRASATGSSGCSTSCARRPTRGAGHGRGAAAAGHRALRRRPGARRRGRRARGARACCDALARRRAGRPACCSCTASTPTTSRRGSSGRSTRAPVPRQPRRRRRAARHRRPASAPCACACSAAATAARRRRSRSSWRSSGRSSKPRPRSSPSTSTSRRPAPAASDARHARHASRCTTTCPAEVRWSDDG